MSAAAEIIAKAQVIGAEIMIHPLAIPMAIGFGTVVMTIVLLSIISRFASNKKEEKETATAAGTTVVDGKRRSTRAIKSTSRIDPDEYVASPPPSAKVTPQTPKEATTVTPKRRGRPAKTPVAEPEPATITPRRVGRPRRA